MIGTAFLAAAHRWLRDKWRGYTDADVESLRRRAIYLGFSPASVRIWLTPGETRALGIRNEFGLLVLLVRYDRALVQMRPAADLCPAMDAEITTVPEMVRL